MFVPNFQQLIQHSASAERLYYSGGQLQYQGTSGTVFYTDWINGNGYFKGNVGIGNANPAVKLHVFSSSSGATPFVFSPLVVEGNGHTYINLLSPNTSETAILFGKPDHSASGVIMYNTANTPNGFQFRNNGNNPRLIIDNGGNVGIGIIFPQARLDVSGSIKGSSLTLTTGGNTADFLVKSNASGQVGFRKAHVGLGLNYCIAIEGTFPSSSPPTVTGETYISEVGLFSGYQIPSGWVWCDGQMLSATAPGNAALFALIGTTYGGDGVTTFAVPDLRDAVPVGTTGNWFLGERSN